MSNDERYEARLRRLGRALYILSAALGVAELGITSRAGEWLSYSQLGQLGALYTAALLIGISVAPAFRNPRVATYVSVLLSALPVIGIGAVLVTQPAEHVFGLVRILWPLSAIGAGILDNVQTSLGVVRRSRGRHDAVAMLGMRHFGTLCASLASYAAVAGHVSAGIQYVWFGIALVLPMLLARALPKTAPKPQQDDARHGTRSALVLVVMGLFAAAAVLPVSLTWAWAEPVMRELHAGPQAASYTLMAFVVAQGLSCLVYFALSGRLQSRSLGVIGLCIAGIGVGLLAFVVFRGSVLEADLARNLAAAGMAAFGWGVAPLPMVVMGRVSTLPLKLSMSSRLSRTVLVQASLVAGGNYLFGLVAGRFTGFDAYVATAAICVGALLLCMRLLPSTKKRASA
jgi:hypothetical protein